MRDYKMNHEFGICGIHCSCCNPLRSGRSNKHTKRVINRMFRRITKQADRKESFDL